MKDKRKELCRKMKWVFVTLPFVFTLLFFGLLPPRFDIMLYTDNIVGEGICMTTTCNPCSFSPQYLSGFYFGSELKKAIIRGYNYDVKHFVLTISGVEEAEIEGFDLRVFGVTIAHYNQVGRFIEGQYDGVSVSTSEDGQRIHLEFEDPDSSISISFHSHFAPVWFWIAYFGLMLLLSLLLALLCALIVERMPSLRFPILSAGAILITLLAGAFFCGSFPFLKYTQFLLNWALLLACSMALNAITLPFLGTVLTMVFTTGWYIANYFVMVFRNKPILPADLKAIGTAAEVMGSYTFVPNWQMILSVIVVAGYAVAVVVTRKKAKHQEKSSLKRRLIGRGVSLVAATMVILICLSTNTFRTLNTFAWDAELLKSFHEDGMLLTYLKTAITSHVKKPSGYSREQVDSYLTEYGTDGTSGGTRPTRIIMVMNEAFSDLRTVGLDDRIDVMPFIDSLEDNALEGSLYVSVFGGGTCNTEFEGLTGNTLAFLGTGAYPYTENVTEPRFSLAAYFRNLGYLTEAYHANEAQNWNRNRVYPNLGFSEFYSIENYAEHFDGADNIPMLHKHPADTADYLYMESAEEQNRDRPRFFFNVTMQNHSGYEYWQDVEKDATVEKYGSGLYMDTQIYLSLLHASDEAVRQLVETYQDSEEPTMIIFFGDHQPGLPTPALNQLYDTAESYLDWYKSKFFIWTNYETEAVHDAAVSANFLPFLILERGNFPLPPYVQMLREVHEKYPVISAMGVVDAEGNIYGSVNDLLDDPLIRKYQYVQYANLFDELDPAWFAVD